MSCNENNWMQKYAYKVNRVPLDYKDVKIRLNEIVKSLKNFIGNENIKVEYMEAKDSGFFKVTNSFQSSVTDIKIDYYDFSLEISLLENEKYDLKGQITFDGVNFIANDLIRDKKIEDTSLEDSVERLIEMLLFLGLK